MMYAWNLQVSTGFLCSTYSKKQVFAICVLLTHPMYVRAIKGKETDKKDSKWIADLFKHDLVLPSQQMNLWVEILCLSILRNLSRVFFVYIKSCLSLLYAFIFHLPRNVLNRNGAIVNYRVR